MSNAAPDKSARTHYAGETIQDVVYSADDNFRTVIGVDERGTFRLHCEKWLLFATWEEIEPLWAPVGEGNTLTDTLENARLLAKERLTELGAPVQRDELQNVSDPNPFAPPKAPVADPAPPAAKKPPLIARIGVAAPWAVFLVRLVVTGGKYLSKFSGAELVGASLVFVLFSGLIAAVTVYSYRKPGLIGAALTAGLMILVMAIEIAKTSPSTRWLVYVFLCALALCGLYGVLKMRRVGRKSL